MVFPWFSHHRRPPEVLKKELLTPDAAGRSALLLAVQLGHQAVVERLWLGEIRAVWPRELLEMCGKYVGDMIL